MIIHYVKYPAILVKSKFITLLSTNNHRNVSTFSQQVNMVGTNLVLWITIVEQSVIMKEIAVEMWLRKFNIPNTQNFGFLNQLGKKTERILEEMMQKVVKIKSENITFDTLDLPNSPAIITPNPRPENMDSRKIVRSRFI